jgi:hypothetical protein
MLKTDLLQFRLELILGDDWWHDHQLKSSCYYHRDSACSSQEPWGNLQDLDLSCGDTKGCVETEDFGIPVWATPQGFFWQFGACIERPERNIHDLGTPLQPVIVCE